MARNDDDTRCSHPNPSISEDHFRCYLCGSEWIGSRIRRHVDAPPALLARDRQASEMSDLSGSQTTENPTMARKINAKQAEQAAAVANGQPSNLETGGIAAARKVADAADTRNAGILANESTMVARFKAFVSGTDIALAEWCYLFKRHNLYRSIVRTDGTACGSVADYLRDRLSIAPADGRTLKNRRNAFDYLAQRHALTLAETPSKSVKGTPAERFDKYVGANFKVGDKALTLAEMYAVLGRMKKVYDAAVDAAAQATATAAQKIAA